MGFDSFISILFIFIFFILPIILKRMKKKSAAGPLQRKKNASVFERIGEQVQQFVSDLEQKAGQEKTKEKNQGDIWEILAEDETTDMNSGSLTKLKTLVDEKRSIIDNQEAGPEKIMKPRPTFLEKKKKILAGKPDIYYRPGRYALNTSQKLKQAVVWSEILSKPVALREK